MWLPVDSPDVSSSEPCDGVTPRLAVPDQCIHEGRAWVSVTTPAAGVVALVAPGPEVDPGDVPVLGASDHLAPGRHDAVPVPLSRPSVETDPPRRVVAVLLLDASGDDDPDFDGSDAVARDDTGDPVAASARLVADCADCRADPPVVIDRVHADAAGRENASLGDEFVVLRHVGCRPRAVGGWTLSFGAGDGQYWSFPGGAVVLPEQTVVVATGDAGGPDADVVLGRDRPVLHNRSDRVRLWDDTGTVVDERSW